MNKIVATISQIHNIDNLNIVEFDFSNLKLKMMSLDLSDKIKTGQKVILTVKPTNIAMAKNLQGDLSYSNQLPAKIIKIEEGKLLTVVNTRVNDTDLQSIFTSSSLNRMKIKENDNVTLLFKASDLSILDVVND
ncbi:TOBE domain-containing protein [Halarcobacter sp.]|uniref:TOBE domain-containing protein n=1 Tax=Halarcobacter sp. TaxID=2321133 RepID=UPI0029F54961|nr:TOBE domain-containing protein [Halarcobacter sp.]